MVEISCVFFCQTNNCWKIIDSEFGWLYDDNFSIATKLRQPPWTNHLFHLNQWGRINMNKEPKQANISSQPSNRRSDHPPTYLSPINEPLIQFTFRFHRRSFLHGDEIEIGLLVLFFFFSTFLQLSQISSFPLSFWAAALNGMMCRRIQMKSLHQSVCPSVHLIFCLSIH